MGLAVDAGGFIETIPERILLNADFGIEAKTGENDFFLVGNRRDQLYDQYDGKQNAKDMDLVPYYLYRQKNIAGNFENVGYARDGKYGIYNILIMEEVQTIVALGAGSITKRVFGDGRIERCDNVKDVALYIEKIDEMIDRKRKLLETN